jgi:uncharacterized membrane protein YphA (DoxX/SURF4 family)
MNKANNTTWTVVTWIVITLLAMAFAAAGTGKLMGVEMLHLSFANLGLPSWFGYFIGTCEIAGAIALFIRPLSGLAAAGLTTVMLGAIYYHLAFDPIGAAVPAIVLALLAAMISIVRKDDTLALLTKLKGQQA